MSRIREFLPESTYTNLRKCKALLMRTASGVFNVLPVNGRKIVFSSFNGRGYGDNPKALAEAFHKDGGYDLFWLTEDRESLPDYITALKPKSLASLYHMSTAKIWIDNFRKDPYYIKRKGQYYIQTWHGNIALKKIEKDVQEKLGSFYVYSAKRDAKMVDLMISNSKFSDWMYKNSFWYSGDIQKFGSPRLDSMFKNESDKEFDSELRKKLGIPKDNYIVLYAPTFRNSLSMDAYDLDYVTVADAFRDVFKKEVTILARLHPNLTLANKTISSEYAINVTDYPDVYELLALSDAMITDYSSLMFEFPVVRRKPVFCYAKDQDEYDRGFYFDLEKLPFDFTRTNEELEKNIRSFDPEEYEDRVDKFFEELELLEDGHASERVVNYVKKQLALK